MATEDQNSADHLNEEVLEGDWTRPQIDLKEVSVKTGEENEEVIWKNRSKLYRWMNGEWKERGIGDAKLLKHNDPEKIRFLLRQEKTLKIVANHYVPSKIIPHVSSDKIWVWSVMDYAEDEPRMEQFALKLKTAVLANEFRAKFEEAAEINAKTFEKLESESKSQVEAAEYDSTKKETSSAKKDVAKEEEVSTKPADPQKEADSAEEGAEKGADKESTADAKEAAPATSEE